ncbi:hypothetical protein [Methylobacterium persicinum]|uniref:Glycosyl transferase n=1 Tax=Methylobacterium persicinum TaxID=374426 RepID=A0ABU0HGV2_9HYPH|nr:hypothetical protein [Methylobacterium persicinum]MDQ0441541.1 hypothetical protein [Methylobacterium persicinum]GJE39304.1 hypothetical protein KHHGKMAE_3385 [Methylobacterium persicinum]
MSAGDHAVCVAINDRDRAWYEMLVPFILSLRQTDYNGRLIVISFGLSANKIDILRRQSIEVIEATEHDLPTGRFVEVAKLATREPTLKKLANYDADIWFCSETFDLFDCVDGDDLLVCRDAYFCDFITEPLIGPERGHNAARVRREVLSRHGSALQAGLVAGTTAAWRNFGNHLKACQQRIGIDFKRTYGTDTCFLHLWAAEDRVALLPETQNFVTKNGVTEIQDPDGQFVLMSEQGPIRGLHMTYDIRFLNRWRYYTNRPMRALQYGRVFALKALSEIAIPTPPRHFSDTIETIGLEIGSIFCEDGSTGHAFQDGESVTVIATGNHSMTLRAVRPLTPLVITVMTLSGLPGPIRTQIRLGEQQVTIQRDMSQWIETELMPGDEIQILTESLPGQMCKIAWILSDRHAMSQ